MLNANEPEKYLLAAKGYNTKEDCMSVFLIKITFLAGVPLTYIILFVNTALAVAEKLNKLLPHLQYIMRRKVNSAGQQILHY